MRLHAPAHYNGGMPAAASRRPQVLSMLICERVIQDGQTGSHTLVGVLNRPLALPALPAHRDLGVYISLTGMDQPVVLQLRLTGPRGVLMQVPMNPPPGTKVQLNSVQEIAIQLSAQFGEEGQYGVEIGDQEGPLAGRGFTVVHRPPGPSLAAPPKAVG
jgi:hypothetical protein